MKKNQKIYSMIQFINMIPINMHEEILKSAYENIKIIFG